MSNKLTGKAFIDATGMNRLRTSPGATLHFGGFPRNGVSSDLGAVGYQEGEFEYPFIECEQIHGADIDIEKLKSATDITVTFLTDTGKSWVLQNAWVKDILTLDSKGKLPTKFEGMRVDPVS